MNDSRTALRRALRASTNRHWLARIVIAAWALHIPLVALYARESIAGRALATAGLGGLALLVLLAAIAGLALLDSAVNDSHLLPSRLTQFLMAYRHVGFMLLALVLVVAGGGIALHAHSPIVFTSFFLPAAFCVVVTYDDLYARHQGRK
jgi:hypothetical protein